MCYLRRLAVADFDLPMANPPPTFSISELAQEFALTTRAIRFYEDEGLIAPTREGRNRAPVPQTPGDKDISTARRMTSDEAMPSS